MVLLTMTSNMVIAIQYLLEYGQAAEMNNDGDPAVHAPQLGNPVSHEQVLRLAKTLSGLKSKIEDDAQQKVPPHSLDELLRGSRVYIEPPKSKAEPVCASRFFRPFTKSLLKTPEYKTLMARLRREEEAREYERMINPPPRAETFSQRFPNSHRAHLFPVSQVDIGDDEEVSYADVSRQMAVIINVLISIVTCSVFIWVAARRWSTPSRLGLSMGGSSMVGVAEVVVYAGYLRRIREAKEKGKKAVEIKDIVKTWVIGSEEEEGRMNKDVTPIHSQVPEDSRVRRRKPAGR